MCIRDSMMIDELTGAWLHKGSNEEQLLLFVDGYHTHTVYNKAGKNFIETSGGAYNIKGNQLHLIIEFNTVDSEQTGQTLAYSYVVTGDELTVDANGKKMR